MSKQPKKLDNTQLAELAIKYVNGISISALAKEYKIDWTTCKRYLEDSKELQEQYKAKKQDTVTEWLEANKKAIMDILSQIIGILPERLSKASVKDLMGAYKILAETSINNVENKPHTTDSKDDSVEFIFTDTSITEEKVK